MIDETGNIDERRLMIPALAGLYRRLAPLSYAFIRVLVGALFLPIGIDKLFFGGAARIAAGNILRLGVEPPLAWAWTVAGLEFFGALLLMLGLFTRPVAFIMSGEMAFAYFISHAPRNFYPLLNGGDAAVLFCFIFFYFAFAGAGPLSLDAAWRKQA